MPKRIQRKRTAGWRMPDGAIYVGRPSRWGNPYVFEKRPNGVVVLYGLDGGRFASIAPTEEQAELLARKIVVRCFRDVASTWDVSALRGHDLACWCPEGFPCHADVLLELANEEAA